MSGSITPELLLDAYSAGIFPMSDSRDDPEIFWIDPEYRGILPLNNFHISKSLARKIRQQNFTIRTNTDFAGVVAACANRKETWISERIFNLYSQLHDAGHAHSIEFWVQDKLAGGVYGVAIGGAFFGESMFSRQRDASKIALAYLVDHLRQQGFTLFDTQFITSHLASLGACEVPREEYQRQLRDALTVKATFSEICQTPSGHELIQRMTQIS